METVITLKFSVDTYLKAKAIQYRQSPPKGCRLPQSEASGNSLATSK